MPPQSGVTEVAASSSEAEVVYPIGRARRRIERRLQSNRTRSSSRTTSPDRSVAASPTRLSKTRRRRAKTSRAAEHPSPQVEDEQVEARSRTTAATKRKRKQSQPPPWPEDAQDLQAATTSGGLEEGGVVENKTGHPKRRRNPKTTSKEASPSSSQRSPLPKRRRNGTIRSEASASPAQPKRKKSKKRVFSADEEENVGDDTQASKGARVEDDPFAKWDDEEEAIMHMSEPESEADSEAAEENGGDAWSSLLAQRPRPSSRKTKKGPTKVTEQGAGDSVATEAGDSQKPPTLFDDDDESSSNIDDDDYDDDVDDENYNEFEDEEEVLEKARQYREALNKKIDLFHSQRQMLEEEVRLNREAMERSMLARMLFFVSEKLPLWTETSDAKQGNNEPDPVISLPLVLHHGVNLSMNDLTQRLWPLESSQKVWNEAPVSLQDANNRAASIKTEISKRAEAARKWALSNALGYLATTHKNSFRLKAADVNERVAAKFPAEYRELQELVALDDADIAETQAVLKLINEREGKKEEGACEQCQGEDVVDDSGYSRTSSAEEEAQTDEPIEITTEDSPSSRDGDQEKAVPSRGVQKVARRRLIESESDQSIRSPCKLTSIDDGLPSVQQPKDGRNEQLPRSESSEDDLPTPSPARNAHKERRSEEAQPSSSPLSSVPQRPQSAPNSASQMANEESGWTNGEPAAEVDVIKEGDMTHEKARKPRKKHRKKIKMIKSDFIDQYAELSGEEEAEEDESDEEDLDELVKDGFITHDGGEDVLQGLGRINMLRQAQQEFLEEKQYKALFTMEGVRARRRRHGEDEGALSEFDEDEEDEREAARRRRRMGIEAEGSENSFETESADNEEGGESDDDDNDESDWSVSAYDENEMGDINAKGSLLSSDPKANVRARVKKASTRSRFRKMREPDIPAQRSFVTVAVEESGQKGKSTDHEQAMNLSQLKTLLTSRDEAEDN